MNDDRPHTDDRPKTIVLAGSPDPWLRAVGEYLLGQKEAVYYLGEWESQPASPTALPFPCVPAAPDDFTAALDCFYSSHPLIDAAVINPGLGELFKQAGGSETIEPWQWEREVEQVIFRTYQQLKQLARRMSRNRQGKIILLLSSPAGAPGQGGLFSATICHGLAALVKTAALEYGRYNILINALATGAIKTAWYEPAGPGLALLALRRAGQLSEFCAALALLVCHAASYITGQVIRLDGGNAC